MIATHSIKYNGVWYKAGDEIKETAEVDNTSSAFSKSYTKTEINRMSSALSNPCSLASFCKSAVDIRLISVLV